jgi:hypothetical protein
MNAQIVTIERGTTAIYVKCQPSGRFAEAPSTSVFPFLKQYLTEYDWDARRKVSVIKYYYYRYNKTTEMLHLPINICRFLEDFMKRNLVEYVIKELEPNKALDININRLGGFKDREDQIDAINFLTSDMRMKALESQTGCLTGDTSVTLFLDNEKNTMRLDDAYRWFHNLNQESQKSVSTIAAAYSKLIKHPIKYVAYSGVKSVYKLTLENGMFVKGTTDHEIQTYDGMIPLSDTLNRYVMYDNERSPYTSYSKVISIDYIGEEPTYDICCKAPHHNFVANGIVVSNSGKTYMAIRSIIAIGKRAIIVVPASLIKQWILSIEAMSDAKIGVIQGSKTIFDIIASGYDIQSDILLASISTMYEYASGQSDVYSIAPPIRSFMKGIKVGVKIVDECHLNFSANNLIDIQSDVAHNLYLSATYLRSSKNSRAIFRRIYPDEIKFNGNDYNKYVNITECRYSLGPIDVRHVQTNRGWSQYKYEKFLLRSPKKMADFLDRVLHPVVEQYYIEKRRRGQKLLVLVGLTELAEFLTQWFRSMYPDLVSTAYIYGTEESMVLESDIIVSTVGSAGTGKDIKGLRSMILFTSFSSESLTLQTIGRLRKMEDTPEFVYMVNTALDHTKRHADIRRPIYRHIAASFGVIEV